MEVFEGSSRNLGGRTGTEAEGRGPVSGRLEENLAGVNGVAGGRWRRGIGPAGGRGQQGSWASLRSRGNVKELHQLTRESILGVQSGDGSAAQFSFFFF